MNVNLPYLSKQMKIKIPKKSLFHKLKLYKGGTTDTKPKYAVNFNTDTKNKISDEETEKVV